MTHAPKIVFLDVDGPMVPGRAVMLNGNSFMTFGWTFDPVAVSMLNFMYWAVPDMQIVIASHRFGDPRMRSPFDDVKDVHSLEFWTKLLEENGIAAPLHKMWHTPRKRFVPRPKHMEITDWLAANQDVEKFVVLEDDLNGGDSVSAAMRKRFHLVAEDYDNGMTWRDFKMACSYLGLTLSRDKYVEWSMTA